MAKYYKFDPDIECKHCNVEFESKDLVNFRCPNCDGNLYGYVLAKVLLEVQPMTNPMVTTERLNVTYIFDDCG